MKIHPSVIAAHAEHGGDLEIMQKLYVFPDLVEALEACHDYFDNRSDADFEAGRHIPNKEMQMLTLVCAALSKAGA